MVSRLLALLVLVIGAYSWSDSYLLEPQIGFDNSWALVGIAGAAVSLLAIYINPRMRVPLGAAAVFGIVIAVATRFGEGANDHEYLAAIIGLLSGVLMSLSAFVALCLSFTTRRIEMHQP